MFLTAGIWATASAKSYYYYENFGGATLSGWDTNFYNSRDVCIRNASTFTNYVKTSSNYLYMRGDPNTVATWDQWYIGRGSIFKPALNSSINQSVTASSEEPFGFQIIRYTNMVHLSAGQAGAYGDNDNNYGKGLLEVWMLQDNGAGADYTRFNNYVFFYDKAWNAWNYQQKTNNTFGYFSQVEYDVPWTNLIDSDGYSMDPTIAFRRRYGGDYASGTNKQQCTNALGIKMTHDGSQISIYLNLDPLGQLPATYKNSWVLYAQVPVAWSNNLLVYLGAESPTPEPQYCTNDFQNFMVRSVSSNMSAFISPQNVETNSLVTFTITLTNQWTANDSGIGELVIKRPAGFTNSNWILSSVAVSNSYNTLTRIIGNTNPPNGSFGVTNNKDNDLVIRFSMTSSNSNQIMKTFNEVATISFNLWTPSTPNSTGDSFSVYADCYKHADTGQEWMFDNANGIKYATTGKKKAFPADLNKSMKVYTYGQPKAFATVEYSPTPLIIGNSEANFRIKLSTIGITGSPDISYLRVMIPSGFTVSNNTLQTNITSSKLGTALSLNNITVTNITGSNWIYVNYLPNGFRGYGDFDTINFNVYGTPVNMPQGVFFTNYTWRAEVDSTGIIAGTSWQTATNQYGFTNLFSMVVISNSQAYCYISPNQTGISTNYISNTYSYVVSNVGQAGNNLYKLKIPVANVYTNFINLRSALVGNAPNVIWYSNDNSIYVDYTVSNTNILTAYADVLTFTGILSNTNLNNMSTTNVSFVCYADNGNAGGFQQQFQDPFQSWSVAIKPPSIVAANSVSPYLLYTSALTNTITNTIYNIAPRGILGRMAKIELPAAYFNTIVSVTNTQPSTISLVTNINNGFLTNSATNYIFINYTNNLLAIDDNPTSKDIITIRAIDSMTYSTFTGLITTNIPMNTYLYKSSTELTDVINRSFTTNYSFVSNGYLIGQSNSLNVENPPVNVAYSVSPANIDSTTNMTLITYVLTNKGDLGNRVLSFNIPIPIYMSRSISNISVSDPNCAGAFDSGANLILVTNKNPVLPVLDGGQAVTLTFAMYDQVNSDLFNEPLYPTVTNDRELASEITNTIGNGLLSFILPKPNGGGAVTPNIFFVNDADAGGNLISEDFNIIISNRGTGSDMLYSVLIGLPEPLQGMASSFYTITNLRYPGEANINYIPSGAVTNIEIIYSNTVGGIPANDYDSINLNIRVNGIYNPGTNGNWKFYANNGFQNGAQTYFQLTNTNAGFGNPLITGTERVGISQVGGDSLTTDPTNYFVYTIKNGVSTNNLLITDAKLLIPFPPYWFTNINFITSIQNPLATPTYWITNMDGSNYIWINGPIAGGYSEQITMNVPKDILAYGTNVDWKCTVYYSNNSVPTELPNDYLKVYSAQAISPPQAFFYGFANPNSVSMDFLYGDIQLTITNIAELGNNIFAIKIIPPTTNSNVNQVVTNINQLSSLLAGTNLYYTNWVDSGVTNGYIYVDYNAAGTNIPSGGVDIVYLRAWDNQNVEGFGRNSDATWNVSAANLNLPGAVFYNSKDPINIGRSLTYKIANPEYTANYSVSPTTASTFLPAVAYQFNIFNTSLGTISSPDYNITNIRVYLKAPLQTNGITASSTLTNAMSYGTGSLNGTNYIEVYYPAGAFVPKTNDLLTITVPDTVTFGTSNVTFDLSAMYTAIPPQFFPVAIRTGYTNLIQFSMTNAQYYAYLAPQDTNVYNDYDNWDYHLVITNVGSVSNNIYKLNVIAPDTNLVLTNLQFISNLIPAAVAFDGTNLFLNYGTSNNSIPNGGYDIITVRGFDNRTSGNYTGSWQFTAANSTLTNAVMVPKNASEINQTALLTIGNPGYYAYYNVNPVQLSSVLPVNTIQVYVNNVGTAGNNITNVRVYLPYPFNTTGLLGSFTNTLGYSSAVMGADNGTNFIEVMYPTNRFQSFSNDTLTLNISNGMSFGETNTLVNVFAQFNTSADKRPALPIIGGTNSVDFVLPYPKYFAYIQGSDTNISMDYDVWDYRLNITNVGEVSNNLYKIKIMPPAAITNLVFVTNTIPAFVYQNAGFLYIDYYVSNSNSLHNLGSDTITMRGYDDQTTSGFSANWSIWATNSPSDNISSSVTIPGSNLTVIGQSAKLNIINPGYSTVYNLTTSSLSTFTPDNDISIALTNNGAAGSAVSNVRIYLTTPFVTSNATLTSSLLGGTIVSNGTNFVQVGYINDVFARYSNDVITIHVNDTWTYGNTNVSATVKVNYTTSADKYKDPTPQSGTTNVISFVMPTPKYYAYVQGSDTNVGMDFTSYDYRIVITNVGDLSNNIAKLKVALPGGSTYITNAQFITSLYPGAVTVNSTNILIDYSTSNTSIPNGGFDVLTIRGYDNQNTPGATGNWNIWAANNSVSPATNAGYSPTLIAQGTGFNIVDPGYSAEYNLQTTNFSTLLPDKVYQIAIRNTGLAGNSISNIRLLLTDPFTTNVTLLSNRLGIVSSNTGANYLDVQYPLNVFAPNSNDVLTVRVSDTWSFGNTNLALVLQANYNTSADQFKSMTVNNGTNIAYFVMPPSRFYGYLFTNDINIGKDNDSWNYHIIITNVGEVSNNLSKVRVVFPGLSNLLTNVVFLSNTIPAAVTIDSTNMIIDYSVSNMVLPNSTADVITIQGYDNQTNSGFTGSWTIFGANSTNDSSYAASYDPVAISQSAALNIINPNYNTRYHLVNTSVSTVVPANELKVLLKNIGVSGNIINSVRVYLDYPMTTNGILASLSNTLGIQASNVGNQNGTNFIQIDYPAGVFGNTTNDTLSFTFLSAMQEGSTNVDVPIGVQYNTSAGKYIAGTVGEGINTLSFIMPPSQFYGYVDSSDVNVFKDFNSWTYQFVVTNTGSVSNDLYKVRIIPPATNNIITSITFISNRIPANRVYAGGILYFDYSTSNSSIPSGGYDLITIQGYDNQTAGGYSGNWAISGANRPSYPYTNSQDVNDIGQSVLLKFIDPGYASEYYLGTTNISTVLPDNQIKVNIVNLGSIEYANSIQKARVYFSYPFNTNGLTLLSNSLSNSGYAVGNDTNGNYFELTYLSNRFGVASNDTISLRVKDDWAFDSMTTNINVMVAYETSAGLFQNPIVNDGTNSVNFVMPAANFLAYADSQDVNISMDVDSWDYHIIVTNMGDVSNNLYKLKIIPPGSNNVLTNLVYVSNTIPASVIYDGLTGFMYVNYSSNTTSIQNGARDIITLRGYDNKTNAGYSGIWQVQAANWQDYNEVTGLNPPDYGQSLAMNIVNAGYAAEYAVISTNISPLVPYNRVQLSVRNTSTGTGNSMNKLKLYLPAPFITNGLTLYTNSFPTTGVQISNESSTNFIEITYVTNVFGASTNDLITLSIADNLSNSSGSARITAKANFATSGSKYITLPPKNGTNLVQILMQQPNFLALMNTNDTIVSINYDSWDYRLTITNLAGFNQVDQSNVILKLAIIPPFTNNITNGIMTNIEVLSNSIPASIAVSNSVVWIDYTVSNNAITNGAVDTLVLRGYKAPNILGYMGNWRILGANLPYLPATNASQNQVGLTFVSPGYASTFSISPTNTSTALTQNTLTVNLLNNGVSSNQIISVRVYLPYPFSTNNALTSFTSGLGVISSNLGQDSGTNYLEVAYQVGRFTPQSNETLQITLGNELKTGNINVPILVRVRYNTSLGKYIDAAINSGTTNVIRFVMPAPSVANLFQPSGIYTSQTYPRLKLQVINQGSGYNEIRNMKLYVPVSIKDLIDTTNLLTNFAESSGAISNLTYTATTGLFDINYTNFQVLTTNTFYLELSNVFTNNVESFTALYNNGSLTLTNTLQLSVDQPPSGSISTRLAYSPYYSNYIQMNIQNDSSGILPIKQVRIAPPVYFTNILTPTSANGALISNTGTDLILTYPAGIVKGASDLIAMWVVGSNYNLEVSNIAWTVQANSLTGFGDVREASYRSLKQDMIVPLPEVSNIVKSDWFLMKTGAGNPTNQFQLDFTNQSAGANGVLSNIIILPNEMTNIKSGTLECSYPGSMVTLSGNRIAIEYTNSGGFLPSSGVHSLKFSFINSVGSPLTVNVKATQYNYSTLFPGFSTFMFLVDFKPPQEPTEAYVVGQQVLYTLDHSSVLKYRVNNGMYDIPIMYLTLKFDTNLLSISNIQSLVYSNSNALMPVQYTVTPSNLIIDYTSVGGITPKLDTQKGVEELLITVNYQLTNHYTNDMTARVTLKNFLDSQATVVPNGERSYVPIIKSSFGRMYGYALPTEAKATIKLYYTGTTTVATNEEGTTIGQTLIGSADLSGWYFIDFVPQGNYDVVYTAQNYRDDNRLTNVYLAASTLLTNNPYKMRRSAFVSKNQQNQTVSVDDPQSMIILPADSLYDFFAVDIWRTNFTAEAPDMADKAKGSLILSPQSPGQVVVYLFDMNGNSGDSRKEQELKNDVVIKLHYYDADISAQGWDENKLGLYYWRFMTKEWVRIGGVADTANNVITAKVSYLHRYYAIFGENASALKNAPGFVSVRTDPKVFTPRADDRSFKNIKISIGFENTVSQYQLKIYDLRGKLLKSFDRSGEYKQGEVYWDGKDDEGFDVKSGVYIFRIIAGQNVYSGTIIIAR